MSRKKNIVILFSILLLTLVMLTTVMDGTDVKAPVSVPLKDKGDIDPAKNDNDPDEETKVLKVTLSMEPEEFSLLQSLTYEFESAHSEIDVMLTNIPKSELYRTYKRNAQLGNASDVMLLDNIWINEFAALGYLSHRIDEFFSSELQSQQIEDMMSQVKWNGYIWGVPKDVDPYVMIWNKTRLAEVQVENPPTSVEELISINGLLRDRETDRYGLYLDPTDPYALLSLLWTAGGGSQNTTNNKVTLNDTKTLLLLESLFSDKVKVTEETPEVPSIIRDYPDYAQSSREMLLEGKIAFMVTRASLYRNFDLDYLEMTPLPLNSENNKSSWMHGRSYGVSSHTANTKEAFEWIQALTVENKQIEMTGAGGGFPSISTAYESAKLEFIKPIKVISKAITQSQILPVEPLLPKKMMVLQTEMEKLFKGEVSILDFLIEVDKQWLALDN